MAIPVRKINDGTTERRNDGTTEPKSPMANERRIV